MILMSIAVRLVAEALAGLNQIEAAAFGTQGILALPHLASGLASVSCL